MFRYWNSFWYFLGSSVSNWRAFVPSFIFIFRLYKVSLNSFLPKALWYFLWLIWHPNKKNWEKISEREFFLLCPFLFPEIVSLTLKFLSKSCMKVYFEQNNFPSSNTWGNNILNKIYLVTHLCIKEIFWISLSCLPSILHNFSIFISAIYRLKLMNFLIEI